MPELPEVEVVRRGLVEELQGSRVVGWWLASFPNVGVDADLGRPGGEGWPVGEVGRHGKRIRIELGDRAILHVHLGMSGSVSVTEAQSPLQPHTHARLHLEDERELRYVDPRRFGHFRIRGASLDDLGSMGPDALGVEVERLAAGLRAHRLPMKAALLNQRVIAGIGNIYADEILFAAGLHPLQISNRLKDQEIELIAEAMQSILQRSIESGGSSIRDYVDTRGRSGSYQQSHCVYGRADQSCVRCAEEIRQIAVAGRSTYYCPRCQPMRRRIARPLIRRNRSK